MECKQIGTAKQGDATIELYGVKDESGRWVVARQKPVDGNIDALAIPSKSTFGEAKQAAAEHFAAPKFAFARHQPAVDGPAKSEPAPDRVDGALQVEDEPAVEDAPEKSEADHIREHLAAHPGETNKDVIAHLKEAGVNVTSSQVSAAKRELKD